MESFYSQQNESSSYSFIPAGTVPCNGLAGLEGTISDQTDYKGDEFAYGKSSTKNKNNFKIFFRVFDNPSDRVFGA